MDKVNPRPVRRRILQNYLLVWVDPNIDESSSDHQDALQQLGTVVNDVTVFTDSNACVKFLRSFSNEKTLVITSGELGQDLVPCIHEIPRLHAIYILGSDRTLWMKEWPKIKDVYAQIELICEALQNSTRQYNQESPSMSFIPTSSTASTTSLDRLEPSFMYTQLFKDALLKMAHDDEERQNLVTYCRKQKEGRLSEIKVIDEFEREYCPAKAIWWYTRECFTYQLLPV